MVRLVLRWPGEGSGAGSGASRWAPAADHVALYLPQSWDPEFLFFASNAARQVGGDAWERSLQTMMEEQLLLPRSNTLDRDPWEAQHRSKGSAGDECDHVAFSVPAR